MEKPLRRRTTRVRKKYMDVGQYSIKIGATEIFNDFHALDAKEDEKEYNEKQKQE